MEGNGNLGTWQPHEAAGFTDKAIVTFFVQQEVRESSTVCALLANTARRGMAPGVLALRSEWMVCKRSNTMTMAMGCDEMAGPSIITSFGAESASSPATSDRRAIRSPNINPRLRPSQIRGTNIQPQFRHSRLATKAQLKPQPPPPPPPPITPLPPKSKLSIHQSCPDPATGRRPERRKLYRHHPEHFSFSRLRRHGFSTNSWSRIRLFIAFTAFQLATGTSVLTAVLWPRT